MGDQLLRREEFLAAHGGRRAADAALASGAWQRVLRGAYAPGGLPVDLAVRCRAAQLLLPAHARVADRCLLWVLGVDVLPPGPPLLEVVVPRSMVVPRRSYLRARTAEVAARDRFRVQPYGLRCLRPVRAVADLLRMLPLPESVVVADAVQHESLCSAQDLQEELRRHAGLRGVRRAADALALSDSRAESPPETRLRVALLDAGLRPVPQFSVLAHGRFVARVDLAIPHLKVAIEYDGRLVHEREDVFARDRQRQNQLVQAGWLVLRFSAADLRYGAAPAVAQVLAACAARAA